VKRPLIGTSWKMNLTPSRAAAYCAELRPLVADLEDRTLFVLPPFTAISAAREALFGSKIQWGAQDVHPDDEGAHTGDVSASMLADLGCTFVEVGHHERRRDYHEDDELTAAKVAAAQRWGMTAILCIGEATRLTYEEASEHVLDQLRFLDQFDQDKLVVAYEPAWAIGTGAEPAGVDWVASIHAVIGGRMREAAGRGAPAPVIYGGSVDLASAGDLISCPGVDGLFVGRAALKPEVFSQIAHSSLASRSSVD
jgi:L-erythrulose 1-phosphate isomerase